MYSYPLFSCPLFNNPLFNHPLFNRSLFSHLSTNYQLNRYPPNNPMLPKFGLNNKQLTTNQLTNNSLITYPLSKWYIDLSKYMKPAKVPYLLNNTNTLLLMDDEHDPRLFILPFVTFFSFLAGYQICKLFKK